MITISNLLCSVGIPVFLGLFGVVTLDTSWF